MSSVFKRFAGNALNLSLDLFPAPAETKYVRAFLYDKDGVALAPASVDVGGGRFVETSTVMQNIPLMKARLEVYTDAGYTELDCEYPGEIGCYELDSLLPTQMPTAEGIDANFGDEASLGASLEDVEIGVGIISDEIKAEISSDDEVEANTEGEPEVSASLDSDEIKANLE